MVGAPVLLFACGDVMTGRGVDQILPHPGDSLLREAYADDARAYVRLAEQASGPIPQPVSFAWPWGDALQVLDAMAPDVRLINLETAVTRAADFAPGKAVHYRMSPLNLPCVAAVRPDVCVLANNHVLDFGRAGLAETLDALDRAGLAAAGAGRDAAAAWQPAAVPLPGGGRMLVFSCGTASSGIPPGWAAATARPGVSYLPSLSAAVADTLIARVGAARQDGDLVVVSIHWGPNWGYDVPTEEVRFAHQLIDGGVSLIHGHSAHHPRPAEVYRGRLILYGCGDCIDDYEGISGYEEFRDELRLLYFASLAPGTGTLQELRMVPMRARKMRLRHASAADVRWLAETLTRVSRKFGSRIEQQPDGTLLLCLAAADGPDYLADRGGKAEPGAQEAERRPPVPDPDNAGEGRSPRRPLPDARPATSPVAGPERLAVAARGSGVTDPRVLEAIRRTPRAVFVPGAYASRAYDDAPVPIPHGQVTTQPSLSAAMIAALGLTGAEEVLEVGTGYGYQTALLARLAARVVSIDIWPDLAAQARRNLAAQGIGNVVVLAGDGTEGAPAYAPFDAIVVSAACPRVPSPLAAELRIGGRLVQPIGPGGAERVVLYEKGRSGLRRVRTLTAASFVRLHGHYGVSGSE